MDMISLDGGDFMMGETSDWIYEGDGEIPRSATVAPFEIAKFAVTNEAFLEFTRSTGHVTDAEHFGWSFVFGGLLPDDFPETRGVVGAEWWRQVFGASWRHPEGPQSSVLEKRLTHPVVHISWHDATAYCNWSNTRLPTETEWEFAARAGTETTWHWGDELLLRGEHQMNVFQGVFPSNNTGADGWLGTCPVDAFGPNGFGLYNTTGNVWEWTSDVFGETDQDAAGERRVMKGGSYLCHESYCRRFRPAARMGNAIDSGGGNVGFRCAKSRGQDL